MKSKPKPAVIALGVIGVAVIGVFAWYFTLGQPKYEDPAPDQTTDSRLSAAVIGVFKKLTAGGTVSAIGDLAEPTDKPDALSDGWKRPLTLTVTGTGPNAVYTVRSAGPDGTPDTEDDRYIRTGVEFAKAEKEYFPKNTTVRTGK